MTRRNTLTDASVPHFSIYLQTKWRHFIIKSSKMTTQNPSMNASVRMLWQQQKSGLKP